MKQSKPKVCYLNYRLEITPIVSCCEVQLRLCYICDFQVLGFVVVMHFYDPFKFRTDWSGVHEYAS